MYHDIYRNCRHTMSCSPYISTMLTNIKYSIMCSITMPWGFCSLWKNRHVVSWRLRLPRHRWSSHIVLPGNVPGNVRGPLTTMQPVRCIVIASYIKMSVAHWQCPQLAIMITGCHCHRLISCSDESAAVGCYCPVPLVMGCPCPDSKNECSLIGETHTRRAGD